MSSISENQNLQNLAAGGLAGATAVYTVQPLLTKKLDAQKGVRSSWHPRVLWAGVTAIAVGDAIVVGMQNVFFEKLKTKITETTLVGIVAGIISGIPATCCEITMDRYRQNLIAFKQANPLIRAPNYLNTLKSIWANQGIKGFFQGFKCTAAREVIFTLAWKKWSEQCSTKCSSIISNPYLSLIGGGIMSGTIGAILSHPFDTAKVKIQNGLKTGYLHEEIINAMLSAYTLNRQRHSRINSIRIIAQEFIVEGFRGFPQRLGLIVMSVTIISLITPAYTQGIQWLNAQTKQN